MNSSVLTLKPMGLRTEDGWVGIEWFLDGYGDQGFVLRHAVPEADQPLLGAPERGDHALVCVLLWAMQHGKNIVVEGKISPILLDGLETLQSVWQRWRPNKYHIVDIRVGEESEIENLDPNRSGLFAFSGGVDGSFSLFRHLYGHAGRKNRQPGAALMVHGMDIPLERKDFFERATERAEHMLNSTGVPLLRLRTNSRKIVMDWEDCFILQLSGCFLVFQRVYSYAIIGSSDPYEELGLPWGSSPITDPLCSTGAMKIEGDGYANDRTEKVGWLVANTQITNDLRVCWAGSNLDRNCGECEKCIRTMLNFWAVGAQVPSAFPTELNPKRVRSVRPKNTVQLLELQYIQRHALQRYDYRDPVLTAVTWVIRRAKFAGFRQTLGNKLRRLLKRE